MYMQESKKTVINIRISGETTECLQHLENCLYNNIMFDIPDFALDDVRITVNTLEEEMSKTRDQLENELHDLYDADEKDPTLDVGWWIPTDTLVIDPMIDEDDGYPD